MKRTAILLQGPPGVGKDTVGEILVRNHGFTRYAFADKVRQFAEAINPSILIYDTSAGWAPRLLRIKRALEVYGGWDNLKRRVPSVRSLLQRIGTEGGREVLGQDCWVGPVMRDIDENPPTGDLVFTDARFENELEGIWTSPHVGELFVLNITRPGFERVNDHVSENYQLMANTNSPWLNNNGTLASLEETLRYYISNRRFHNAEGKSQEWEAFHVRAHA